MGRGVFLGGQPRHCICTNASRSFSAIAEFLVFILRSVFCRFILHITVVACSLFVLRAKDCRSGHRHISKQAVKTVA